MSRITEFDDPTLRDPEVPHPEQTIAHTLYPHEISRLVRPAALDVANAIEGMIPTVQVGSPVTGREKRVHLVEVRMQRLHEIVRAWAISERDTDAREQEEGSRSRVRA